jgi:hypothetical protein
MNEIERLKKEAEDIRQGALASKHTAVEQVSSLLVGSALYEIAAAMTLGIAERVGLLTVKEVSKLLGLEEPQ